MNKDFCTVAAILENDPFGFTERDYMLLNYIYEKWDTTENERLQMYSIAIDMIRGLNLKGSRAVKCLKHGVITDSFLSRVHPQDYNIEYLNLAVSSGSLLKERILSVVKPTVETFKKSLWSYSYVSELILEHLTDEEIDADAEAILELTKRRVRKR